MRNAVICEPVRTAVGGFGGQFRGVAAVELAATALGGLLERTALRGDLVDDVILGQCYPTMEAPAIGRIAALDAGLPLTVAGLQLDRRCGSGLQAVIQAVMQVQTGASDVVLAGGVESMSDTVYYTTGMRWGARTGDQAMYDQLNRGRVTSGGKFHPMPGGMIETAENLRKEYSISRDCQDQLAVLSHQRAVAAQRAGLFDEEIVPVIVRGRRGDETVVITDEHPRPDISFQDLAALRPLMSASDPESTVTAGNASGQNDGAAVCIVTTPERAEEFGLRTFGRMVSWAVAGVPPETMGIGPVSATARAMERSGLTLADMDLIEINEAFAAQVLACTSAMHLGRADFERINVNGSGISLGHPVGATGGRILATLLREMERRGARYGLETMCIWRRPRSRCDIRTRSLTSRRRTGRGLRCRMHCANALR